MIWCGVMSLEFMSQSERRNKRKGEFRNPSAERNPKSENRTRTWHAPASGFGLLSDFGHSDLGFVIVTRVPICFRAIDMRISAIASPERVVSSDAFPERGALLLVNTIDTQSNTAAGLYSPSHLPTLTPRVGQPWGEAGH